MGFFSSIGSVFKSIGKKIGQGAKFIGQKAVQGLDYGIQGAKIATDFADKYTLGLDHFIPYYSAIKAGIDISDHIRKMVKGEEKFNLSTGLDMGLDVISGAMSLHGGKAELEGLQGGYKMFKGARATGSSLAEASKIAGGRVLRGYGLHSNQLRQMGGEGIKGAVNLAKAVRKGEPMAVAKTTLGIGGAVGAGMLKLEADKQKSNMRRTATPPPPVITPLGPSGPSGSGIVKRVKPMGPSGPSIIKPRILVKPVQPIKQAPSIVPQLKSNKPTQKQIDNNIDFGI